MEVKGFSGKISVKNKKSPLLRWLKIGLGLAFVLLLMGTAGIGGVLYYFSQDLPSLSAAGSYAPSQATRIYSDKNEVIGEYYIEKRVFVPFERMPKHLIQSILAVEDARFYDHKGFDPIRIVRAFIKNIESGAIKQGASTITQQVTRALFLTPERTIQRKIKELILSRKMEIMLSKNEILEIYLNQIYFGHGAYGVQVASLTYFGKDVSEITLEEAAFLAGLPKAPNNYSPYRTPKKAKFRQRVVLKRLLTEQYITEDQYREAYENNLVFQKLHQGENSALYFKEYVRQYLMERYGADLVYKGGLNVYTTLNEEMQEMAERALTEGLRKLDKRQGYRGPIRIYQTDEVEDTVQVSQKEKSKPLKMGEFLEARILSWTDTHVLADAGGHIGKIFLEDMLWAARRLKGADIRTDRVLIENAKPGDILKPDDIVLVRVKQVGLPENEQAAQARAVGVLEETLSENDTLFSLEQEPIVEGGLISLNPATGTVNAMVGGYDFKRSEYNRAMSARRQPGSVFKPIIYGTAIERGFTPASILIDNPVIFTDDLTHKVWKPENYEKKFYGPTTLREALTHSRNLATVKLLRQVGIKNVVSHAQRIGIKSPLTRDLSLALGSSGVSLLELTSAFGVYANAGIRVEPTLILSVTDKNGRVLESRDLAPKRVVSEETAYVVTNILEDVVQRGTARRARVLGRPVAGKTGTTNEYTDAWFIGYTPNVAAGIWVGFDDNRSLGRNESGGRTALPIWVSFMEKVLAPLPVVPFAIPDGIVYAKINRSTGYLSEEGESGEMEIFVKGTEPKYEEKTLSSPTDFFRFDQESGAF